MSKRTIFIIVLLALACWIGLLVWASSQELTVVRTERIVTSNSDINNKDCLVTTRDSSDRLVQGYAEASACVYLKMGDKVKIVNGYIKR